MGFLLMKVQTINLPLSLLLLALSFSSTVRADESSFSWRHPEAWIWFKKIVPSQYITGTVNSLKNPQEYKVLLYVLNSKGWQRYPFDDAKPTTYSGPIEDDGSWFFSLAGSLWNEATFAVLIVEPPVAENAPKHVETLEQIQHMAREIHANVLHGEYELYPSSKRQTAANGVFYYFDPAIAELFQILQTTTVSKDKATVLILEDVQRPGIYEVDRKFNIHAVLEVAGGYGFHEKHELPYVVKIFKNIRGAIEVEAIVYRGQHKQLPGEQKEIFLESGDIIDIPRMLCD